MAEPWFDPSTFGAWYGAIVGGGGGTLMGCFGGLTGYLAPRGIGRRPIMAGWVACIIIGVAHLAFGLAALIDGQPYAIWYPFLLVGVLVTTLFSALLPVIRLRFRQAEERKIDADAIRHG